MDEDDDWSYMDDETLPDAVKAALQARDRLSAQGGGGEHVRSVLSFRYSEDNQDLELARFDGPLPIPSVGERVYLWHIHPPFVVDRVGHLFTQSEDEQVAVTYIHVKVSDA